MCKDSQENSFQGREQNIQEGGSDLLCDVMGHPSHLESQESSLLNDQTDEADFK